MSRTLVSAAGAPDQFPLPEALEPSISQPGLIVANVYPVLNEDGSVATHLGPIGNENEPDWPTDGPKTGDVPVHDVNSHVEATEYAFSRFDPRAAGTKPELIAYEVPTTVEQKVRDGWKLNWTPKKAAALFAGTFILFNAVGNAASIIADTTEAANSLLHRAKTTISNLFGHKQELVSRPVEVKQPGEIFTVEYTYNEAVGESTPEPEDIDQLINDLKAHGANGETVLDITIEGGTSDEWGAREGTLGKKDEGNKNLGIDRASDFGSEFIDEAMENGAPMPPKVKTTNKEYVLNQETISALSAEAKVHKLSLRGALTIYNKNPNALPDNLRTMLDQHIGNSRGVRVTVTYQKPDVTHVEFVQVENEKPVAPENKDHDYDFYWFIPTPFWPRNRKELHPGVKYETWLRPGTEPDERWVELFKDAVHRDENGKLTLDRFAAMETRKYWLLARENRIDYTLTHNYLDSEGKPQSAHVLFIDHDPTEQTVEMYKKLLNDLSQMRDGKVGEQLGIISVFPRDQVGLGRTPGRDSGQYPHHPADIGLGIDDQERESVYGITMPALGLVEVHMPENPTAEELNEYYGALWVAAHEAAGHFTDTTEEPTELRPIGPAQLRHFTSKNPWVDTAAVAFEQFPDVNAPEQRNFNVTWQVATADGEIVTLNDTNVEAGDARLSVSQKAKLVGLKPDLYSGMSAAELYGQIGAQVVSGALIPYGAAGVPVIPRHEKLGRGYAVDPELRRVFEERTGWSRETARPVNEEEFTLMLAMDDPVIGPMIKAARRKPMEDDRITILSRVHALDTQEATVKVDQA